MSRNTCRKIIAVLLLLDAIPVGYSYGFHQAFVMFVLAWIVWRVSALAATSEKQP